LDAERTAQLEERLAALLYDGAARARRRQQAGDQDDALFASLAADELEAAARQVRQMVLGRVHRGTGGLSAWYPRTLAAWRARHDEDATLDGLAAAFCASEACAQWRESATGEPGISLEEAWYRFFTAAGIGDPIETEDEFLGALLRALAITPGARFRHPATVRPAPGGHFAVSRGGTLHAALDGRYVHGALPGLLIRLLAGTSPEALARETGLPASEVAQLNEALRGLRLLA
jgi:hypothetical protein